MASRCPVDAFRYPAEEVLQQPYAFYEAMRTEAPVYHVPDTDVYVVSRSEDLVYASQHPEIFSSRRVWMASSDPEVAAIRAKGFPDSNSLTTSDPPEHRHFRSLAMKVLSPRRFAKLEPGIRALANRLVDAFIGDGKAELQRQYSIPLPLIVIADLLGLDHDDLADLKRWSDDYSEALASNSRPLSRARALECAQSLTDFQLYLSREIECRRATPTDDTLTDLIQANDAAEIPIDHAALVDMARIFVIGGNETTALAVGTMMRHLLERPERFERLRQEPALVTRAVEESLRFDSPSQWNGRTTLVDTVLGGTEIPKGSRIYLNWASGNRDPERYPDRADEFDLDRPAANGHLAFGFGTHFCAGAPLSRMELRITLEVFIERLHGLRLADKDAFAYRTHPILRGLRHLHVEFDPA
jgi:cytochrome P450